MRSLFVGILRLGNETAVSNGDLLVRAVLAVGGRSFDLANDIHALKHTAEDNMATIKPRGLDGGDEEL